MGASGQRELRFTTSWLVKTKLVLFLCLCNRDNYKMKIIIWFSLRSVSFKYWGGGGFVQQLLVYLQCSCIMDWKAFSEHRSLRNVNLLVNAKFRRPSMAWTWLSGVVTWLLCTPQGCICWSGYGFCQMSYILSFSKAYIVRFIQTTGFKLAW